MARINLLPWREELRKQRKVQFFTTLVIAAVMAVGVCGLVHFYFEQLIKYQNSRNQFLEQQISLLDKKIKEIQDLEREKERLLARMRAIETLQTSRPVVVHLFDELVTTLPEGVFLKEVSQKDMVITIKGVARSNARVSNFMRNIEQSKWITNPKLSVIETKTVQGQRIAEFTLTVQQKKQTDETDDGSTEVAS